MCGIAGFFGKRPQSAAVLDAMLSALSRRGPDAQHWTGWNAEAALCEQAPSSALLHARLSIRDPRPIADQPMRNEAGDIWICYNGEVYGWEDEAKELERAGHVFYTRSDTEFILRGYEAWGFEGLLPHLRGMFALVVVDWRQRKVWAARDRMGLKPLLYYHDARAGEFAFGSLLRSVLPYLPAGHRDFSPQGIDAYLAHRYIPAPLTVFQHVHRLENGHWLCFDLQSGALRKQRYWQPEPLTGDARAVLDDAIRLRTVADRPVGLFLSSGIDSTAIACRLSTLGYRNIETFTAAFPGSDLNEGDIAADIAAKLGLPHRQIVIPSRIRDDFDTLVADLDEPFADPSSIPTWYLARETTQHVKVVLGGDGGDELFAGYKRYRKHLSSAWRRGVSIQALRPAATLARRGGAKWRLELAMRWSDAYALRFSGFNPLQRAVLQPGIAVADTYWRREGELSADPATALLELDRHNYLPEYILRKADLTTMAHGLEARAPLLDHVFYQHVLALPAAERFTDPAKGFLDPALEPVASLGIRSLKKRGFNPPLKQWLREDLVERVTVLPTQLTNAVPGHFDRAALEAVVAAYRTDESWAELLLQLLLLAESLTQLRAAALPHQDMENT